MSARRKKIVFIKAYTEEESENIVHYLLILQAGLIHLMLLLLCFGKCIRQLFPFKAYPTLQTADITADCLYKRCGIKVKKKWKTYTARVREWEGMRKSQRRIRRNERMPPFKQKNIRDNHEPESNIIKMRQESNRVNDLRVFCCLAGCFFLELCCRFECSAKSERLLLLLLCLCSFTMIRELHDIPHCVLAGVSYAT